MLLHGLSAVLFIRRILRFTFEFGKKPPAANRRFIGDPLVPGLRRGSFAI